MNPLIAKAKSEGRNLLEPEALELLAAYGLPVPAHRFAQTAQEAAEAVKALGGPVAVKIVSPDILHKSDAGGVRLNVSGPEEAKAAFEGIMADVRAYKADARLDGVLVSEMLRPGLECIVGMVQDASFGPALMFGLGGIFVEVLRDVSFRVLPFEKADALAMIAELKGAALLTGVRGQKPKDVDAVAELLVKVAKLVRENPEISELDLNPCFVHEQGAVLADARVML